MNKLTFLLFAFSLLFMIQCEKPKIDAELLINQVGYTSLGIKKVVLQTRSDLIPESFQIQDKGGTVVFEGNFETGGAIHQWHTGKAFSGLFSELQQTGEFRVTTILNGTALESQPFLIEPGIILEKALPLLIKGLQSQHPEKIYEDWDSQISFFGERGDKVDVHGGWYDASGDVSKYLSHLSYANFMSPQQTPLVVWSLLESARQYGLGNEPKAGMIENLNQEAAYGGDFLVRMMDPAGYFYVTIFDTWSKDPEKREICAYQGQDGKRSDNHQAAFREGGGMAIAALARLAKTGISGEYDSNGYLETARKGFAHLVEKNLEYLDDGQENIIDEYCALMAAQELFATTGETTYLEYARGRMQQLVNRVGSDSQYEGWWRADDGTRPYFHAAEAGFPVVALCRYLDLETEESLRNLAIKAIRASVDFELEITGDVNNPFGYPRQYVKALNEETNRAAFFIPHQNESGYWWQGENARLGSLASAFNLALPYLKEEQKPPARSYSTDLVNWILGLNPYDMCMLEGLGRNNPEYKEPTNLNYPGGVCNGITAGFVDETDIAFMPSPQDEDPAQRWRWAEQWIPHSAWLMLAVTSSSPPESN